MAGYISKWFTCRSHPFK